MSSYKSIPRKNQQEEDDDENDDSPGKFLYQEYNTCEQGDNEYQKIREHIFPCNLFLVELFHPAFWKKH